MIGILFLGLISYFPLVYWSLIQMATIQLAGAIVLGIIVVYFLLKFLPKSNIWNRLILQKNIDPRRKNANSHESVYRCPCT